MEEVIHPILAVERDGRGRTRAWIQFASAALEGFTSRQGYTIVQRDIQDAAKCADAMLAELDIRREPELES